MNKIFPRFTIHPGIASELDLAGNALVPFNGKVAQVAFTLSGEKIIFEEAEYRRKTYYNLKEIVNNLHAKRVVAPCPHFTICGGCLYQHMDANFYKNYKLEILKNTLSGKNIDLKIIDETIVIPAGLRRKANFEAVKKHDQIYLGFHRYHSRQIINLETCKLMRPEITVLLAPIKEFLNEILEDFQKCEFFIVSAENGLDVGFEIQLVKILNEEQLEIARQFAEKNNLIRLIFRHGNKQQIIHNIAEPFLAFGDYEVAINPWAFMQTSKEAERALMKIILQMIPENLNKMADLFCGRGTYSLSLAHKFKIIDGFELAEDALNALSHTAIQYNLPINTTKRDLFTMPLLSDELAGYDLVIINPPRAGAKAQCEQLINSGVNYIIYVSCNPASFAQDAELFIEKYDLVRVSPLDQFIWSNHLEIVGLFKKKQSL